MRDAGFSADEVETMLMLENSIGLSIPDWPPRARTAFFMENVQHPQRLTLIGFVFGNGGNLYALKRWFQLRGMLTDPSSWADVALIEGDVRKNAEFREKSFYWDIINRRFQNFFGDHVRLA